jgi:methionine-rich copper-binding protein CopC
MTHAMRVASIAAFLLLFAAVVPALAHSELVTSDPTDGATIQTPYTLKGTFSEDMDPNPEHSFMRVQTAGGDVVAFGGVDPDDATVMTVDIPALDPGEYTVRWQTTTLDDNGVERGTFTFKVGAPTATTAPTPSPKPSPGQPAAVGNDIVFALVLAVIVIGAIAIFLFTRRRR